VELVYKHYGVASADATGAAPAAVSRRAAAGAASARAPAAAPPPPTLDMSVIKMHLHLHAVGIPGLQMLVDNGIRTVRDVLENAAEFPETGAARNEAITALAQQINFPGRGMKLARVFACAVEWSNRYNWIRATGAGPAAPAEEDATADEDELAAHSARRAGALVEDVGATQRAKQLRTRAEALSGRSLKLTPSGSAAVGQSVERLFIGVDGKKWIRGVIHGFDVSKPLCFTVLFEDNDRREEDWSASSLPTTWWTMWGDRPENWDSAEDPADVEVLMSPLRNAEARARTIRKREEAFAASQSQLSPQHSPAAGRGASKAARTTTPSRKPSAGETARAGGSARRRLDPSAAGAEEVVVEPTLEMELPETQMQIEDFAMADAVADPELHSLLEYLLKVVEQAEAVRAMLHPRWCRGGAPRMPQDALRKKGPQPLRYHPDKSWLPSLMTLHRGAAMGEALEEEDPEDPEDQVDRQEPVPDEEQAARGEETEEEVTQRMMQTLAHVRVMDEL